jgi:hypothetical protein
MSANTPAVQAPQGGSSASSGDLELKCVGSNLVVTFHRNAYGADAMGTQGQVA